MINMNLNSAGYFSTPAGYPVRLSKATDTMLSGVLPNTYTTVSAVIQTEKGTANAHLALYTMPTTSGGNDGALVVQSDLVGLSTSQQTLTVTAPTSGLPTTYVVRLWVDSIAGSNPETISRDGTTAASALPSVPTGVKVASVTVA